MLPVKKISFLNAGTAQVIDTLPNKDPCVLQNEYHAEMEISSF